MDNLHPLSSDLTQLTHDDLDKKYNELMNRYAIARRMGMDQGVLHQIEIMLDGIEWERVRRIQTLPSDSNPVVIDTDKTKNG